MDENGAEYKKSFFVPRYFRATWVNTRSICRAYGFDIASFETSQEFHTVVNLCKKHSKFLDYYTYIGAVSLTTRSITSWYWANSGKRMSFEISQHNLDFAGGDEWCLALGPANNFLLNDVNCNGYESKFLYQKIEFML